jgi:hypothetical protein
VVISLFNGIRGAFRIYDVLGIAVMGKISIDIFRDANHTTRSTWPEVMEYHNVEDISLEDVLSKYMSGEDSPAFTSRGCVLF